MHSAFSDLIFSLLLALLVLRCSALLFSLRSNLITPLRSSLLVPLLSISAPLLSDILYPLWSAATFTPIHANPIWSFPLALSAPLCPNLIRSTIYVSALLNYYHSTRDPLFFLLSAILYRIGLDRLGSALSDLLCLFLLWTFLYIFKQITIRFHFTFS